MNSKLKTKIQEKLESADETIEILRKTLDDVQLAVEEHSVRITDIESLKMEQIDPQDERIRELDTVKDLAPRKPKI